MGLEVLAGRIIAPVYGNSVYTWGAVLGVFMTFLAIGYWLGGKRAENQASIETLAKVLVYSVLGIALIIVIDSPVVEISTQVPVPSIYAPIIPLLVLFGPPTFLLGFISPYGAELTKVGSTGEASGRVYSLGTVGSIVGAFVTTYGLIPYFSILWIQAILAGLLVVVAIILLIPNRLKSLSYVGLAVITIVAAASYTPAPASASGQTVYETQTAYQQLEIVDEDGVRTMYLNDHPQSAMYLDNRSGYVFGYERYAHLPYLYQQNSSLDRILVIGAAGYSMPKRYLAEYPNVTVDVVEIDPQVSRAGKKYFNVSESPRLNTINADARQYLQNTNRSYDAIVLDAFQKNNVPFHLTTIEFMHLVNDRLDSDGVLVENVISAAKGPRSKFVRSEFKTASRAFPSTALYPMGDQPRSIQNVMVVATKGEPMTPAKLQRRNSNREIGLNLSPEIADYTPSREIRTNNVPVLRDGRAPVDKLTKPLFGDPYVIQRTNQTTTSS